MIYSGNCIEVMQRLVDEGVKVQSCVTSPPYWGLRNYNCAGQLERDVSSTETVRERHCVNCGDVQRKEPQ